MVDPFDAKTDSALDQIISSVQLQYEEVEGSYVNPY